MILIFSEFVEQSTAKVITWLNWYKASWLRINWLESPKSIGYTFHVDNSKQSFKIGLNKNGKFDNVRIDDVSSVWYRRTPKLNSIGQADKEYYQIFEDIKNAAYKEYGGVTGGLLAFLNESKVNWLGHPNTTSVPKLRQILFASEVGLNYPATLVTSSKEEVIKFKEKHERIIIKPVQYFPMLNLNDQIFVSYTKEFSNELIDSLEENFFPAQFQEYIEKDVEIRSFYLDGEFYSMAMFSQNDEETSIDFRRYKQDKPTRRIPFKLPTYLEKKLTLLMHKLNLKTGSFDIIKTEDNNYYFLEVNPVGQFGMVSYPCNYYLEKKIAEYLINNDLNEQ